MNYSKVSFLWKHQFLCLHYRDYLMNFWRNNWWSIFEVVKRLLSGMSMIFCFNLSKHILWLRTNCPDVYSVQICQTGISVNFKLKESKKQPYLRKKGYYLKFIDDISSSFKTSKYWEQKLSDLTIGQEIKDSWKPELIYVTHIFVLVKHLFSQKTGQSLVSQSQTNSQILGIRYPVCGC